MRVLCDQNVPQKYLHALKTADDITVTTVAAALQHDATDAEIARHAETDDWVVFTNDEDFYVDSGDHGLLFYSQLEDPTPGAVVEAIRRIDDAYESSDEIVETVPDGWAWVDGAVAPGHSTTGFRCRPDTGAAVPSCCVRRGHRGARR